MFRGHTLSLSRTEMPTLLPMVSPVANRNPQVRKSDFISLWCPNTMLDYSPYSLVIRATLAVTDRPSSMFFNNGTVLLPV